MIHYLVPREQAFGIADYLDLHGSALASRFTVVSYEDVPSLHAFPAGTCVLAALDQLSDEMIELLSEVEQRLVASGRVRLLNSPSRTLTRRPLLDELHRRGVNPFRAAGANDAEIGSLRFPVFVRAASAHTGAQTPLLPTLRELEEALGRLIAKGWRREQLLIVEFCDTVDADGIYRKYAAFVVGDRVIPRSLAMGRQWMLKSRTGEYSRASLEEELRYVEENPHGDDLRALARIAGVEWGRFDYAVRDRRPVVWEINLNPTIGRGRRPASGRIPAELQPLRETARDHFYAALREALESVDTPESGGGVDLATPGNPSRVIPVLRDGAPASVDPFWLRLARPMRTVLEPLIRPLLVRLGRESRLPRR